MMRVSSKLRLRFKDVPAKTYIAPEIRIIKPLSKQDHIIPASSCMKKMAGAATVKTKMKKKMMGIIE